MKLLRLTRGLNRGIEYLLFVLGASMSTVVAVQVFFRYVLNNSLFWSEEVARYMLVWLTFLGATCAYYRGLHPGIDLLGPRLPQQWRRRLTVVIQTLCLCFFGIMVIWGYKFAWFTRQQISPALNLPMGVVYSIIPISGMIFGVHTLARILTPDQESHHDS